MNSDLISRSELKSVLENECFWCANRDEPCDKPCWHCINEKIDNAPTVELFCAYLSDGEVRQPCVEAPCKHERPQGEWIDTASGYKCSVCGEENDYAYDEYKHKFTDYFCPNCGAKMKLG